MLLFEPYKTNFRRVEKIKSLANMHSLIPLFYPNNLIYNFITPLLEAFKADIDKAVQNPKEAKALFTELFYLQV